MIMTRLCRTDLTRNATRSSVERSAQCRSSTITSTGRTPLSRSRVPSTCSSSCALLMSSPASGASAGAAERRLSGPASRGGAMTWASSGSSRDSAGAAGPSTSASTSGGMVLARVRSASTSGASGRPSPPSSTHCPVSTQYPWSGRERREFPGQPGLADPGLAADERERRPVDPTRSSSPASDASSSCRPMKTGLTTFAPTRTLSHTTPPPAPRARQIVKKPEEMRPAAAPVARGTRGS